MFDSAGQAVRGALVTRGLPAKMIMEFEPPLPVLLEARLDAARAREREQTKAMPLFSVRRGNQPAGKTPIPPAIPQNPWRVTTGVVPADATKSRTHRPIIYTPNAVVGGRSRFRKGVVSFNTHGLTLSGVGVVPVAWLNRVGCAAYIVLGVTFAVDKVLSPQGHLWDMLLRWLVGGSIVLIPVAHTMTNIITEWRREAQTLYIPWSNCLEAQWERGSRWVIIIYWSYEGGKPGNAPTIAHLPLNSLSPAQAAVVWDAFDEHAPGRNRINDAITETQPLVWVIALSLIGAICFALSILIWRRIHP